MRAGAALSGVAFSLLLAGCLDLAGEPARGPAVMSPDGRLQAAIHDRCTGATVQTINWVELTGSGDKFDPEHDVVAIFENGEVRRLAWEGGRLIVYYGDATPMLLTTLKYGVTIEYRPGVEAAPPRENFCS